MSYRGAAAFLFGFVLAGSELLTRSGYAVDRATWQCEDPILDTTVSASPRRR